MPTFRFNKLVRDKLPAMYDELGQRIVFRNVKNGELLKKLRDKLVEEASELPFEDRSREQIISELSDVEQVMDDIKRELAISDEEVAAAKEKKFAKKGGFENGIFVESIELNEGDDWIEYYRKEPAKYPELGENGHVDPELPSLEKGTYRHGKSGHLYEVVGVTFHTETNEPLVIYRPLYESTYELFARPYEMFVQTVEISDKTMPRFEKIND
jgi:predicted house-cleaning noncanonical NTP pyrophosphatase (MazG superfamily)